MIAVVVALSALLLASPFLISDSVTLSSLRSPDSFPNQLSSVSAPTLRGFPLKLLTHLVELPILGPMAINLFAKQNDFILIRRFASALPKNTSARYYPLDQLSEQELHSHARKAAELSLEKFVGSLSEQTEFPYWTVRELNELYKKGTASPVDVASWVLASIAASDSWDPPLRAFVNVDVEDVMQMARASAARWSKGTPLSVLDGVPIAVKDEIDVKGYVTTRGTTFFGDLYGKAEEDADSVGRLRRAGAVIVGKTHMHEIGVGTTGLNIHLNGTTRNPYDLNRFPGGSSGGSAAAVAAGIVPIALGVDGGGSIRIPASLCGVVGLKPTFDRVKCDASDCLSVGHVGPLASSLDDAAIAYVVMSSHAENIPKPHLHNYFSSNLNGVKVGLSHFWVELAESVDIKEATLKAVEKLRSMGAEIIDIELPFLEVIHKSHALTILTEMLQLMEKFLADYNSELSFDTRLNLATAKAFSALDFLSAQLIRSYAWDWMKDLYSKVDVIVSPGTAITAPAISPQALQYGQNDFTLTAALMKYVVLGNFVGLPAITFPVAYSTEGLPINVQVMGSHWDEALLFRIANQFKDVPRQAPKNFFRFQALSK